MENGQKWEVSFTLDVKSTVELPPPKRKRHPGLSKRRFKKACKKTWEKRRLTGHERGVIHRFLDKHSDVRAASMNVFAEMACGRTYEEAKKIVRERGVRSTWSWRDAEGADQAIHIIVK